jgi:hypothetical protein
MFSVIALEVSKSSIETLRAERAAVAGAIRTLATPIRAIMACACSLSLSGATMITLSSAICISRSDSSSRYLPFSASESDSEKN